MGRDVVDPIDPSVAVPPAALDRHGAVALALLFVGFVFSLFGLLVGMLLLWTSASWSSGEKSFATVLAAVCVVSPFALLPILAPVLGHAGILALLPWVFAGPLAALCLVAARYRRRA